MRTLFLSFIFLFTYTFSFSQNKADYTWIFGYSKKIAGTTDSCFGGNYFTFNDKEPKAKRISMVGSMELVNTSYSDPKTGELLFYTNGCYVINKLHQIMKNGDSLNKGGLSFVYMCFKGEGGNESQNHVILPFLDGTNRLALFHDTHISSNNVDSSYFNLSIIDMDKENGLGMVVQKQKLVLAVQVQCDHITAVKNGNGRDWWILFRKRNDNVFYRFLFTPKGIEKILTQAIGPKQPDAGGGGQTVFSPDGRKFVSYDPQNGISIFDFDRCTGLLSNQIIIPTNNKTLQEAGCEISPNSRFLYTTTIDDIWQFDLKSEDISESKTLIDSLPTSSAFRCQTAPNGKIYICAVGGHKILHVIHNPNEKGRACNFKRDDFKLLTYSYASIPQFPRYRMSAWDGSPCDTLGINDPNQPIQLPDLKFKIYPNPVGEILYIEAEGFTEPLTLYVYDVLGRVALKKILAPNYVVFQVDMENVLPGSYIWVLTDGKTALKKGKLIRQRE